MVSYYSIIQYVPDPVADERVNIGVVVLGEEGVKVYFTRRWQRVRQFGHERIDFLQDFARRVTSEVTQPPTLFPDASHPMTWTIESLRAMAREWTNSIQLTPPRASLREPGDLLMEMSHRFLWENSSSAQSKRRYASRRALVAHATTSVKTALQRRFGAKAEAIFPKPDRVDGSLDQHSFDLVVKNGHILLAAQGLSFNSVNVNTDRKLALWAVDDVRKIDKHTPLAIIARSTGTTREMFAESERMFAGVGATVVADQDIDEWAMDVVSKIDEKTISVPQSPLPSVIL